MLGLRTPMESNSVEYDCLGLRVSSVLAGHPRSISKVVSDDKLTHPLFSVHTGWFPVPVIDLPLLTGRLKTVAHLEVSPQACTRRSPLRVHTKSPAEMSSIGFSPVSVRIIVPETKHISP